MAADINYHSLPLSQDEIDKILQRTSEEQTAVINLAQNVRMLLSQHEQCQPNALGEKHNGTGPCSLNTPWEPDGQLELLETFRKQRILDLEAAMEAFKGRSGMD
ncbi:hypothetical protein LTR85_002233 [Meristemomyces frigidus]|nr:hypothetical protein LTR85_002233 [Meristemomyces frigidus]